MTAPDDTLHSRLSALMSQRPDWYQAVLATVAEQLGRTACDVVLRAGMPMPDFVLPNAEGELVFSDDLLARGPLVVCFFRGAWCPFCNATLAALQEVLPAIVAAGATLVALTPDSFGHAFEIKRTLGLGFEVLTDLGSATGLRFGAVYRVPQAYCAALLRFGIDLEQRHGDDAWLLPLPATFVVGRDGILRHAHASGDVTDRTEPAAILRLLRDLAPS
jgi:peroxiredoxin